MQGRVVHVGLPELIERDQGGGRVAAAAAQARTHRDVFVKFNIRAQLRRAFGLLVVVRVLLYMGFQCERRAVNQVVAHRNAGAVREVNLPVGVRRDVNFVTPVDALKHGFQTVVAVRTASGDV